MKRSIEVMQFVGFAVTMLGGTLLHFLFDWLSGAVWVAPFSSVNESTWEHLKLFFWPTLIYAIIERFMFKDIQDFWCVKLKGTLLGMLLIPVLFYTYNGVIGKSPDWINILIFFVTAFCTYAYETKRFVSSDTRCKRPKLAFSALCLIGVLFVVFTFAPPHLSIFLDPVSSTYGLMTFN